jgi:polyphosphate glucokinase
MDSLSDTEKTKPTLVLTVDIGGSHIKATVLNSEMDTHEEYDKVDTPYPANPESVLKVIQDLSKNFKRFDKISVGFPGYVKGGIIKTAPNLGTSFWKDYNLKQKLQEVFGKPVLVVNDADLQGLGVVDGIGFEMVITLGTGFGTALLQDRILLPHIELAHHPISKKHTYDQYVGQNALDSEGEAKWNLRMKKVFETLKTVFNYDKLYISGGNGSKLNFPLDPNMRLVTNVDGIKGGLWLWMASPLKSSIPIFKEIK